MPAQTNLFAPQDDATAVQATNVPAAEMERATEPEPVHGWKTLDNAGGSTQCGQWAALNRCALRTPWFTANGCSDGPKLIGTYRDPDVTCPECLKTLRAAGVIEHV